MGFQKEILINQHNKELLRKEILKHKKPYVKNVKTLSIDKYFAYDTETKDGKAFFISLSDDLNDYTFILKNKNDVIKFFDFCFEKGFKVGFCFNLDYDVIALMVYFKEILTLLYTAQPVQLGNYIITYLKNKNFKIKQGLNKNSKVINFYDIQQFYNSTLQQAADKFLNSKKIDIGENRSNKIFEFFKNDYKTFKKYAIKDARLTYQLAIKVVNEIPNITKYYSAGYIVYQLEKTLNNGFKTSVEVDNFMRKDFYGGRIEFLQRGYFKNVYIYDIKSAYPSIIADLYSIYYAKFSKQIDTRSTYQFINCTITLPENYNIGFAPIRNDVIQFIAGTVTTTIDNESLEYYLTLGAKILKIHKVLNVYCKNIQPYKEVVNKLFKNRDKGVFENYFYKLLLNSCFGKKAERKKQYIPIDKVTFELLTNELIDSEINGLTSTFDLTKIKQSYFKIDRSGRGNHYNIIEASLILSLTRLKLLKTAITIGSENVIGFMTDSIFTTKPIPNELITNQLGGFELQEITKELIVVGSGVYQTDNKTKFRGFNSKLNLKEIFNTQPNKKIVDVEVNSKLGLGSYLRASAVNEHLITLNSINLNERELNINFDNKRRWERELNSTTILNENIKSKIIKV